MVSIGLDIGTTTISAVAIKDKQTLRAVTRKNDSHMSDGQPWEDRQDPGKIRAIALDTVAALLSAYPDAACIGVTGQMHGMLYLDRDGVPVSPLYTWQDNRGEQQYEGGETYAAYLSRLTGYPLATGFGMVTHFYNLKNGLVPKTAAVFCTIHDYIAMVLAGRTTPVTEASDAASFGLFDVKACVFDTDALAKAGIDAAILPALAENSCIGTYNGTIPVYAAIGDNQASFLGATGGDLETMLVNVGTGSQFSVYTKDYIACPGLDTRPFPGGGYLIVGASLCGGRAYALLERFLASVAEAVTGDAPGSCYDAMEQLMNDGTKPENLPTVVPLFQGTRLSPHLRGSITGLSIDNFTPRHLVWAMVEGIVTELYEMYACYLTAGGTPAALIGSGNGLRKNKAMQASFASTFGQTLTMSACTEEAATGAALFAQMNFSSAS